MLSAIDAGGVVAILRGAFLDRLDRLIPALANGGVRAIEISLTSPDPYPQLARAVALAASAGGIGIAAGAGSSAGTGTGTGARASAVPAAGGGTLAIGAGTVRTVDDVHRVRDAGVSFIVAPVVDPEVIEAALRVGLVPVPGAFTPTEVAWAARLGAPAVKLFPADSLGPGFVRGLRAPLPEIKVIPTGGVTLRLAQEFAKAGAWAVGVGGPLIAAARTADRADDFADLAERARAFVNMMRPPAVRGR